ncbi:MAG: glycosyltransferase [Bacteroidota bacterium]
MKAKPITALVTPLDWGLGHATRCIPIIDALLERNVRVIIGSSSSPLQLLQKEYPNLEFIRLPRYDIKYYTKDMTLNVLIQTPHIFRTIRREYLAVQKIVKDYQVDLIISDNRFGCSSKLAYSIFMSHQLYIITPIKWMAKPILKLNTYYIRDFDVCWVPDYGGANNLAGVLCHPALPSPSTYLGILSRMKSEQVESKYDVLFLLSGPEPQRTRLEQILLQQIPTLEGNILLVQGKTERYEEQQIAPNVKIVSYLTSEALNAVMNESKIIVCRSGYSTLMDLVKLGKPALLVPTPGQTEQEYLAKHLQAQGIFNYQAQNAIDIQKGLAEAHQYKGPSALPFGADHQLLEQAIDAVLQKISTKV